MSERKNRWLNIALVLALLSIAVGCDRSNALLDKPDLSKGTASLQAAPEVSFQNLDGQTVSLSAYRGKVVLVNFWGTWCEPCLSEIPSLIKFQQEYGSKGFTVLGVAMEDGKATVASFVAKPQFDVDGQKVAMNYPVVLGNQDVASKFSCCIGFPTSYIISKDGKLVQKVIGPINPQSVNELIQKLL